MEEKQYNYVQEIDGTEITVIVKERENARTTIANKLKSVLLKDLSVNACSKGETA